MANNTVPAKRYELPQGTELFMYDEDAAGDNKILKIPCAGVINVGERTYDEFDDTNLCDDQKQTGVGLPDFGDWTIEANFLQDDPVCQRLVELEEQTPPKDVKKFVMGMAGNKTPPTVDEYGEWVLSLNRTWRTLDAEVMTAFPNAFQASQKLQSTITLKVKALGNTLFAGRIE